MAFKYVERDTGLDFPRYAHPLLDVIKTRPYMGFGAVSLPVTIRTPATSTFVPKIAAPVPTVALPEEEKTFYYPPAAVVEAPVEEESFYYPPSVAEAEAPPKEESVTTPTIRWIGTSGAVTTTELPPKEEPVATASRTWTTTKPTSDGVTIEKPTYPDVTPPLDVQQNVICGPDMQQMLAEDGSYMCVPKTVPGGVPAEEEGMGLGMKVAIAGAVVVGAFLLLRR